MLSGVTNYFKTSIAELQKVAWPTRLEVIRYTVIILVSVIIAGAIVAAIDFGLSTAVNTFLIK